MSVTKSHTDNPYTISLDSKGDVVVQGEGGKKIKGESVCFPCECKSILAMKTINVIEAEGSHYIVIEHNGVYTRYYLAH